LSGFFGFMVNVAHLGSASQNDCEATTDICPRRLVGGAELILQRANLPHAA
jgi:hypothetical protein